MKINRSLQFDSKKISILLAIVKIIAIFTIVLMVREIIMLFIKLPKWMSFDFQREGKILFILVFAPIFLLLRSFKGIIFLLIFAIINLKIKLPYFEFIENHLPHFIGIVILILFGISLVSLGFPLKKRKKYSNLIFFVFFGSLLLLPPIYKKEPVLSGIVFLVSILLFLFIELNSQMKKDKELKQ